MPISVQFNFNIDGVKHEKRRYINYDFVLEDDIELYQELQGSIQDNINDWSGPPQDWRKNKLTIIWLDDFFGK